jgi:Fe-S-cluster containining protein
MTTDRPPFPRTTCACPDDQAACARPAYLIPSDLAPLLDAAAQLFPLSHPRATLRASRGALVLGPDGIRRIPTIVPATRDGRCIFQARDGRCRVHAVKPFGCAYFDRHMADADSEPRSLWGLHAIEGDPAYSAARAQLAPTGTADHPTASHSPPP